MYHKEIHCKCVSKGKSKGEVLISKEPLSFLGGVDPETGIVIDSKHELYNQSISKKILVFPYGKGSTVGSYVLFNLALKKKAPAAIINKEAEPIVAAGAILAKIPMVHKIDKDIEKIVKNGDIIEVDADNGIIKIVS